MFAVSVAISLAIAAQAVPPAPAPISDPALAKVCARILRPASCATSLDPAARIWRRP
jgi:hypothetical protein